MDWSKLSLAEIQQELAKGAEQAKVKAQDEAGKIASSFENLTPEVLKELAPKLLGKITNGLADILTPFKDTLLNSWGRPATPTVGRKAKVQATDAERTVCPPENVYELKPTATDNYDKDDATESAIVALFKDGKTHTGEEINKLKVKAKNGERKLRYDTGGRAVAKLLNKVGADTATKPTPKEQPELPLGKEPETQPTTNTGGKRKGGK